ncbi:MAG: acetyl-CoA carboxylase biotin carboxyl carrier protein [Blastocatellia bacterium]
MKKTSPSKKPATKAKPTPSSNQRAAQSAADFTELKSLEEIKELIAFIAEKDFDEIELERGDFRLSLRKGGNRLSTETPVQVTLPSLPPMMAAPVVAPAPVAAPPPAPVAGAPAPTPEENLHIIPSPIVGTFYRSSSPTAEPFVKPGDQITANQTLCIIEAMKLMNEIQSDVSGTVAKVLVENGQPVEYGQPLFGIKV